MKGSMNWVLFLRVGMAFILGLSLSHNLAGSSTFDKDVNQDQSVASRKLLEKGNTNYEFGNNPSSISDQMNAGAEYEASLDDYKGGPFDPVPTASKHYVKSGPLNHGTPVGPFLPVKPSPPPSLQDDDSDTP